MLSLVKLETTMFLLPFWLKICEETTIVGVQAGMFLCKFASNKKV